MLGVLSHGDLRELGDNAVGGGAPDVGERQGRLVGGDGEVLDRRRRLEDLHVLGTRRTGGRGEDADQCGTSGGAEQCRTAEAREKPRFVLFVEAEIRGRVVASDA